MCFVLSVICVNITFLILLLLNMDDSELKYIVCTQVVYMSPIIGLYGYCLINVDNITVLNQVKLLYNTLQVRNIHFVPPSFLPLKFISYKYMYASYWTMIVVGFFILISFFSYIFSTFYNNIQFIILIIKHLILSH